MRSVLVFLGAGLAIVAGCSSKQSCTEVGCTSGAHFQTGVRFASNSDQLDVAVCRNAACAHGTLTKTSCTLSGALDATCAVALNATSATLSIDIPAASNDDVKDGDTYTFHVTRAQTNESVVDLTKPALYKTLQPNGAGCPPTCKSANLA